MAESTADSQPPAAEPEPAPPATGNRLAEQVAERVYRLMLEEARLARARGQPPPRRGRRE